MTNNTKENIIRYLTNNKKNENASHDLVYSPTETINTNLGSQLASTFSSGYEIQDIVRGRNINGNALNYSVLYGYYTSGSNTRGFIAIIDEVGNLIQTITKYSSNAYIGQIYTMNVDEEGNFFMLENNVSGNILRFVMLNNIVIKNKIDNNYKVQIRKAYAIPNNINLYNVVRSNIKKIIKSTGQGRYAIFYDLANSNMILRPCVTELVVNVGAENQWNEWLGNPPTISGTTEASNIIGTYATWQNDTINFIILVQPNNYPRYLTKYTKSGTGMAQTNIQIETTGFVTSWGESAIILNNTTAYATLSYRTTGSVTEEHSLYKINLSNNTSTTMYTSGGNYSAYIYKRMASFILDEVDEELFFVNTYCEDEINDTYICEVGRIRNDSTYYTQQISKFTLATINNVTLSYMYLFFVNKQFNLYNINVMLDNNTYNTYQIYNRNNYNGIEFNNTKSLLPNSAILYNEDSKPIFARNLYNKIINDSTTVSVVEVPYNYINDITIAKQDLMSFNNNTLVDNEQDIITNQYEELNINFINTISMSNQNDIERPILNRIGASRLNGSISDTLDYTNATLNKIRLIYEDNTTYVKEISPATQVSTYVYKYTFNVYNPNNNTIKEIQLISHDENTTYQTIDFTNQASGKTYKISQNVEIQ